jgi:hypothetical protein
MIAPVGVEHPLHDDLTPFMLKSTLMSGGSRPSSETKRSNKRVILRPGSIEVIPST